MSLKNLNRTQRSAVEATKGPVLIFAGAGSGKTRVLTHKIYYLIREGLYNPEDILAVTFTNKAAKEMRLRIGKLLDDSPNDISIGTFHGICARILYKNIHHLGYTNDFVIYDRTDQLDLLRITLEKLNISKKIMTPKGVASQISLFKNQMMSQEEIDQKARTVVEKKLAEVYPAYQQGLRDNNAVDFDDLLLLPLELFRKYPKILSFYQKKWKYVLVDEYQDTNLPQFLFVSKLAEKHQQICVVGDDDQSIYGWRGANIRNILDFEKVFPNSTVFTLKKNYRSTQKILDAATIVVKNNVDRTAKELYSVNGIGEKLGFIRTMDELEEADAVVSALEKEIKLNKRTFSDFAVLYRVNAQSRALEDSFRRMGIPYNIVGGIRFYARKEVKDMLAYLRLIVNLKDTVSLRRVVNIPPRGIGIKTVNKCVQKAEEIGKELFEILADSSGMDIRGKQADSLQAFHQIIIKYHDLIDKLDARELIAALSEEVGILNYFKNSNDPEELERYQNIRELFNSVDAYIVRNPEGGLKGFIEEVSLLTDIDSWNDQDNRVTLMTLHSAKGLEFPIVFLTGLEDGLFPLYRSLDSRKELEEERRLFYVGLTRAKDRVYLLYATHRRRMGAEYDIGLMSRFLREIPEEYLEEIPFSSALTRKIIKSKPGRIKVSKTRTVTTFDDFKIGDSVEHAIFGVGVIKALSGTGENQRVGVVFSDGLKKKLIVKYANLKKMNGND
ncbi:ATP-dependent helicase [Candidatus Neomarinimicrobiota bacterium]